MLGGRDLRRKPPAKSRTVYSVLGWRLICHRQIIRRSLCRFGFRLHSWLTSNPFESLPPPKNKTKTPLPAVFLFYARGQGFEPRYLGPEPRVLPLDDPRIIYFLYIIATISPYNTTKRLKYQY